jgi:uncharacterized protein with PIN domain
MLSQNEAGDKETAPRLLVDAMLGRLARWLRLMGYDAAYYRTGSDEELARQARAEGRLILTRDHGLAGRRGVWALLINAEEIDAQIAEVRAVLGGEPEPFTRCPECNGRLVELSPEAAQGLVPPYVWHTQQAFKRCPDCGHVYWKGTHWPAMQQRLTDGERLTKDTG